MQSKNRNLLRLQIAVTNTNEVYSTKSPDGTNSFEARRYPSVPSALAKSGAQSASARM